VIGMNRQGGLAEQVCVPVRNVIPLPDGFPWERAAVVEPVAVVVHLFDRLLRGIPGRVAILGAAFRGLVAIHLAGGCGALDVTVVDVRPERLERARHLGADVVVCAREEDPVDAVLRATDGEGADLVIEAAGVTATRRQSISITRPGGTVGVLGLADAESSIDFLPI